jgi:membrane protein YqaA with SNARE-associated domain
MALISLLFLSFAGGIVWVFNVEAAAMLYGAAGGWNPVLVGVTCALGQSLAYTLLFFAGDRLLRRWGWGRRQVERALARYGERLAHSFLALTVPAALVGLPPMTGMAALAGGFRVRFAPLIGIALTLRTVRFVVLAAAGAQIVAWWNHLW